MDHQIKTDEYCGNAFRNISQLKVRSTLDKVLECKKRSSHCGVERQQ